jgi:hypothetical protein
MDPENFIEPQPNRLLRSKGTPYSAWRRRIVNTSGLLMNPHPSTYAVEAVKVEVVNAKVTRSVHVFEIIFNK